MSSKSVSRPKTKKCAMRIVCTCLATETVVLVLKINKFENVLSVFVFRLYSSLGLQQSGIFLVKGLSFWYPMTDHDIQIGWDCHTVFMFRLWHFPEILWVFPAKFMSGWQHAASTECARCPWNRLDPNVACYHAPSQVLYSSQQKLQTFICVIITGPFSTSPQCIINWQDLNNCKCSQHFLMNVLGMVAEISYAYVHLLNRNRSVSMKCHLRPRRSCCPISFRIFFSHHTIY